MTGVRTIDQRSLIVGNETVLSPYTISMAKSGTASQGLQKLFKDDAAQLTRLRQIVLLQEQWQKFAHEAIA